VKLDTRVLIFLETKDPVKQGNGVTADWSGKLEASWFDHFIHENVEMMGVPKHPAAI